MNPEIEQQEDVTVFWDFSSTQDTSAVATISTSTLVKNICSTVSPYGPLKSIRVYWDHAGYSIPSAAGRIRSELSASGVCLIDCPAEGRKDGAMKKMLVDLILHAWDHEAGLHTYVVITTDRDVAYALSTLRMRQYRIILLSPAFTHPDLTQQATIQLDWTKSVLGLTGLSYSTFEDILPATTGSPSPAAPDRQPDSSRLRRNTVSSIYHEPDKPLLPNPHEVRRSSLGFLPNMRAHEPSSGQALLQTPPLASAWSTFRGFGGTPGGSSKPLNTLRPHIGFDPFNEPDDWLEVAPSTESGSSGTRFSFAKPQALSTALTSAEEAQKPEDPKPQSLVVVPGITVDAGQGGGNVATPGPEAGEVNEAVQSEPKQSPAPKLPTPPPPVLIASLPTKKIPAPKTKSTASSSSKPAPASKVQFAISPSIARIWNPLIHTLRANGGRLPWIDLPPKLLKSYPNAYSLAGRSKYGQYIQSAIESGIVEQKKQDGTSYILLTSAYRK